MLCCIGGVCVPYTAVIPLMILVLKWVATKLAMYGLLPESIQKYLQVQNNVSTTTTTCNKDCCDDNTPSTKTTTTTTTTTTLESTVKVMESVKDYEELVQEAERANKKIVIKFTADWCKPCKMIQPLFDQLSSTYQDKSLFCIVDVDDLDEIASPMNVAILPTFCIVNGKNQKVPEKYVGSNEHELQSFLSTQLK